MTVADIDEALGFWRRFLGLEPRWQTVLDRPYLGRHVGYPDVRMKAAFVDLPGRIVLELLEYELDEKTPNPEATANPGNVHLCLAVADAQATWERAVAAGARPVAPDGPIEVDGGPNQGARAAYLRIHDGITVEIFQPPDDQTRY
jgi:catechol 2,3-dioxygenase-like lactoylglutathione lyase family enzyme